MKQALASQGKINAKEKRDEFKKVLDMRLRTKYNKSITNGIGS